MMIFLTHFFFIPCYDDIGRKHNQVKIKWSSVKASEPEKMSFLDQSGVHYFGHTQHNTKYITPTQHSQHNVHNTT